MDLQKQINKHIESAMSTLDKKIESRVDGMMDKVLNDVFSDYGEISSKIKEEISSKLNISLKEHDILEYSQLVTNAIGDALQLSLLPKTKELIEAKVLNLTGRLNKQEWTLEEVLEEIKNHIMEDSDEMEGDFTFLVVEVEERDWVEVYIDEEPDLLPEKCNYKFIFSTGKAYNTIFSYTFSPSRFSGRSKNYFPKSYDFIPSFIFKLQAQNCSISYSSNEYLESEWSKYK